MTVKKSSKRVPQILENSFENDDDNNDDKNKTISVNILNQNIDVESELKYWVADDTKVLENIVEAITKIYVEHEYLIN